MLCVRPPPLHTDFVRYATMDLPFLCTLMSVGVTMIKISYDIACRWSINLFRRIETYSPELRIPEDRFSLEYFIPKFHLPAHGSSCHTRYSFNYRPGVGRTHGENIESGWAHTNPAAVATREMGPGARHSTLDSHWGGWNWRKVTGFGKWHPNCPTSYLIINSRSQEYSFSKTFMRRNRWRNSARRYVKSSKTRRTRERSKNGRR